jgi:AraC-like DNA-binding protein
VSGLDRYDLARQFRGAHGTSPYRYSVLRRLDYARGRLGDGTPLAELALDAGFTDQAHFTRMFRSAFGLTPGRYLALRRGAGSSGALTPKKDSRPHDPVSPSRRDVPWRHP